MGNSTSKITSARWTLVEFKEQWDRAWIDSESLYSRSFSLANRPAVEFALYVDTKLYIEQKNAVGIVLKELNGFDQVKVRAKIWIEDTRGQKYGKTMIHEHVFSKVWDECGFVGITDEQKEVFYDSYNKSETFFICCELTDLSSRTPTLNRLQNHFQNQWSLYERGIYDTVIKCDNTQFKILKSFFMAQSTVFTRMFISNFTENSTNTVEIKDIDKETMKQLVKWAYTGQIQDENQIEALLIVADRYEIELLQKTCVEIMLDAICKDNAFFRLAFGLMCNDDKLKNAALGTIYQMSINEVKESVSSPGWLEFKVKHPVAAKEAIKLAQKNFDIQD